MHRLIACLIVLLFPLVALAQTAAPTPTPTPHPDLILRKVAGVYPIGCHDQGSVDLAALCFARVDVSPVIELGCVSASTDEEVHTTVIIPPTPQDDAELRCYAVNGSGESSDYSWNMAEVFFTAPRRPMLVSRLWAIQNPPRLYAQCTDRVFRFEG